MDDIKKECPTCARYSCDKKNNERTDHQTKFVTIDWRPEYVGFPNQAQDKKADDTAALIGFLAIKLACYSPKDPVIQRALDWLESNK